MFKIKIIALGKLKEQAYKDLEKEFLKRLSPYCKLQLVELPEVPYGKNADIDRIKLEEAEIILKNISKDAIVILLEEKGTLRNSKDFSVFLERITSTGREINFIIGSGVGLHSSLKEHSNYSLSLSPLTFPHNLARILLIEQIYRAGTILNGKEYHK